MRIAIVDDLAAERALLKDRLEQQLHRRNVQADILEYESGETFLEAARKAPFIAVEVVRKYFQHNFVCQHTFRSSFPSGQIFF